MEGKGTSQNLEENSSFEVWITTESFLGVLRKYFKSDYAMVEQLNKLITRLENYGDNAQNRANGNPEFVELEDGLEFILDIYDVFDHLASANLRANLIENCNAVTNEFGLLIPSAKENSLVMIDSSGIVQMNNFSFYKIVAVLSEVQRIFNIFFN